MVLKRACCCLNLAVGTEFIGWFGIFSAVLRFLSLQNRNNYSSIQLNSGAEGTLIAGCFVQIIVCGCLIGGARQKNSCLLLPWLILQLIGVIFINVIVFSIIPQLNDEKKLGNVMVTSMVLADLICGYLWLIVLSLYNEIKRQDLTVDIMYTHFDSKRHISSTNHV